MYRVHPISLATNDKHIHRGNLAVPIAGETLGASSVPAHGLVSVFLHAIVVKACESRSNLVLRFP